MIDNGLIDEKYIILKKIGGGGTSKVFLVKEVGANEKYAAKILTKMNNETIFNNEINILNYLQNKINKKYIINLISYNEGIIKRKNIITENKYLILEFAEKGNLYDYIFYSDIIMPEKYCKLIFYKIVNEIKAIHEAKVCHLDIKLPNILLDENYNPKITDFGFSESNKDKTAQKRGTSGYIAPEVYLGKPYNGFKADIFSLGVTLFTLVTRKQGFKKPTKDDELYKFIKYNSFEGYWLVLKDITKNLSEEFKKLYFKMVSYKQKDRPTIDEILNSKWLEEIKNLTPEEMEKLEEEIKNEFINRESTIEANKKIKIETKGETSSELGTNRGGDSSFKCYFEDNLKPKCIESEKGIDNYILIKGSLYPSEFMNILINKIKDKYENFDIIDIKDSLKFTIVFQEIEEENNLNDIIPKEMKEEFDKLNINEESDESVENNDEEEDEDLKNESHVQVKLFKLKNGEHLLRFMKKNGDLEDYYKNLSKIVNLVKSII